MQEILLEDQLRTQLNLHDPQNIVEQAQQQQQQQQRRRKVKKSLPKTISGNENEASEPTDVTESLKNEIEYMPSTMKTPISILQELLSRRGAFNFPSFNY